MGKIKSFSAVLLIFSCVHLFSQETEALKTFKECRNLLFKGEAGDTGAVEKAIDALSKLMSADPNLALAKVFLGTAYNLKSKAENELWEKMKWVQKGIALQDQAVKIVPDNIWARMERGANNLRLPPFFNRLTLAKEDFDYLVNGIETKPDAYILNAEGSPIYLEKNDNPRDFILKTKQCVYYNAGEVYEKMQHIDKAKEFWEKAVSMGAATKYGKKAGERLNGQGK